VYFDKASNTFNLLNDQATAWQTAATGSPSDASNGQCSIDISASSMSQSGGSVQLTLAMNFAPTYAGTKSVYMSAADGSKRSTGWQSVGSWNVPQSAVKLSADSVFPNSGSGASQIFAFQYSDASGAQAISLARIWFGISAPGSNTCLVNYTAADKTVNLLNDAGTALQPGALGSNTVLRNSQCSIDLANSSAVSSTNGLLLSLAMSFTPAYAGAQNIYLNATDASRRVTAWQLRGTWTVPTP
jgi:hypothetical protein